MRLKCGSDCRCRRNSCLIQRDIKRNSVRWLKQTRRVPWRNIPKPNVQIPRHISPKRRCLASTISYGSPAPEDIALHLPKWLRWHRCNILVSIDGVKQKDPFWSQKQNLAPLLYMCIQNYSCIYCEIFHCSSVKSTLCIQYYNRKFRTNTYD